MKNKFNFKKLYPFIPVIGIFLTMNSDPEETNLINPPTLSISAIWQAVIIVGLIIFIILAISA